MAGSAQEQGALVAYKPDAGVVEEKVEEQRIAVVDAARGRAARGQPGRPLRLRLRLVAGRPAAGGGGRARVGHEQLLDAELYVVDAASGETRSLWKPPLQIAQPRWSPDGASIAVIHGLMSDEGSNGGDVMLVPAAGGAAAQPHRRSPRLGELARLAAGGDVAVHRARGRRD